VFESVLQQSLISDASSDEVDEDNTPICFKKGKSTKKPYFTKSVSLASLLVSDSHSYCGPVCPHHEGDFTGK